MECETTSQDMVGYGKDTLGRRGLQKTMNVAFRSMFVELFQASLQFYGVRYKTVIRKQMMTLILTRESANLISVSVLEVFFFQSVSVFHF